MADAGIYDVLMAQLEPDARTQAVAMADALRRKQAAGNFGLLTGDKVLSGFGQAQLQQAGDMERMLAQAGQHRSGQALQRAMAAQREQAEMNQAEADRAFRTGESEKDRAYRAGEAEKGRGFEGRQNALQRAMQRELEGMRDARTLEAAKIKAQADAKNDATKLTGDLRKEFNALPETKEFKAVSVAFDKVKRASQAPSAAGDLSAIFAYMKMLDPNSSVREGEFANAQNATGIPGQVANTYNRMLNGERLSPEQRADFLNQAQSLYAAHESQYSDAASRYRGLAEKSGISADDVAEARRKSGKSKGLSDEERAELQQLEREMGGGGP